MHETLLAVNLGVELAVAAGFVVAMVACQTLGLVGISILLRLEQDRLFKHDFDLGAIGLLSAFGLLLLTLHLAEIFIFALFYAWVGASASMADASFYSASAYVTLGLPGDLGDGWRLIGALEALIGFVLIAGRQPSCTMRTWRRTAFKSASTVSSVVPCLPQTTMMASARMKLSGCPATLEIHVATRVKKRSIVARTSAGPGIVPDFRRLGYNRGGRPPPPLNARALAYRSRCGAGV